MRSDPVATALVNGESPDWKTRTYGIERGVGEPQRELGVGGPRARDPPGARHGEPRRGRLELDGHDLVAHDQPRRHLADALVLEEQVVDAARTSYDGCANVEAPLTRELDQPRERHLRELEELEALHRESGGRPR